jgi:hypothetical protein
LMCGHQACRCFRFLRDLVLVQRGLIDIGLVEDLMGNRLVDT